MSNLQIGQPVIDATHRENGMNTCLTRSRVQALWISLGLLWGAVAFAQAPPDMRLTPAPAPQGTSIPLLADAPDQEQWEHMMDQTTVRNVTRPALYPVLPPAGQGNGKAVIVVPGGGYQFVSMDSEGFRVAYRLAQAGYTSFVLKYRTMTTARDPEVHMRNMAALFGDLGKRELADHPPAVDDLAAALARVTREAAQWKIDPAQIHIVGFSAGSRTEIRLLEQRHAAVLARSVALIYPPMTQKVAGGPRPPPFLAIAVDDPLFRQGRLGLLDQWLNESMKVEFHLYSGGSHGFGMRPMGTTSDHWIDQYLAWLAKQ